MAGKRGLIMGLANDKSIAWGIAKCCAEAGAELCFSFQGEALKKRVKPLAEKANSNYIVECDVSDAQSLDALFDNIEKTCEQIKSMGGSIVNSPALSNDKKVKVAYCHDIEGVLMEIVELIT